MALYFITGCSRGIGLEYARQLLEADHTVIATARHPERSKGLGALCEEYDQTCRVLPVDITSAASIEKLKEALRDVPAIDVLINNAGVLLDAEFDFEDLPIDVLQATLETNVVGPMRLTQALLPWLRKSRNPKVVNMTSQMGSIADDGSGGYYAYRISKTALNMFSTNLAVSEPDLTVLSLHPGWVQTEMGGPGASISVEQSVRGLLALIDKAGHERSGHFYNYQGRELPW